MERALTGSARRCRPHAPVLRRRSSEARAPAERQGRQHEPHHAQGVPHHLRCARDQLEGHPDGRGLGPQPRARRFPEGVTSAVFMTQTVLVPEGVTSAVHRPGGIGMQRTDGGTLEHLYRNRSIVGRPALEQI